MLLLMKAFDQDCLNLNVLYTRRFLNNNNLFLIMFVSNVAQLNTVYRWMKCFSLSWRLESHLRFCFQVNINVFTDYFLWGYLLYQQSSDQNPDPGCEYRCS